MPQLDIDDEQDWKMDGPTTAAAIAFMLDGTQLLNHLDSTERSVLKRAVELLECLPAEPEPTPEARVVQ
jgi:hypothetical protein